jgi:hypothetical protein
MKEVSLFTLQPRRRFQKASYSHFSTTPSLYRTALIFTDMLLIVELIASVSSMDRKQRSSNVAICNFDRHFPVVVLGLGVRACRSSGVNIAIVFIEACGEAWQVAHAA